MQIKWQLNEITFMLETKTWQSRIQEDRSYNQLHQPFYEPIFG